MTDRIGRQGFPKPPTRMSIIEAQAVEMLARKGQFAAAMRDRLDARYYLMSCCGWTAEQCNEAQRTGS